MLEIRKNIFMVKGENGARFPFCTGLYLRGRNLRVLVDAGMGAARTKACAEAGVDVLILTHSHYDHRSSIKELPAVPVWCHEPEAACLEDHGLYMDATGFLRSGIDFDRYFKFPVLKIDRRLKDGEELDLGGIVMRILHAPGHTPGHICLFFPKHDFLFSADVALDPFGPFYGNDFSDVDDFIRSIGALKALSPATVLSSHCGPFEDDLAGRFDRYEAIIYERDRRLMEMIERPCVAADFHGSNFLYANYPRPTRIMQWMELVHVEKHLDRLVRMGMLKRDDGLFIPL
ncbi:MAG TPA: MBL fold metallo-hydrolase [Syntrophales bacterium]|nr:MBL fold metallo-hydrolase [Syntrophales bacterium]